MPFTHDELQALPTILSAPRFATYLAEKNGDKLAALELYQWNLELSAAFIVPLHICEVSVRNSIVTAIEATYGLNWPWERGFEITLRKSSRYSPRDDLLSRRSLPTSGKIIAELKFAFWEKMFTKAHDQAIWNPYFRNVFPNADRAKSVQALRAEGFDTLGRIRSLRNRIAHHEPIIRFDIQEQYDLIRKIIAWTDLSAAGWVDRIQTVTQKIATRP